ncbi:MAG: sigma-70 family RNA polymerase sigma factor [Proteobacteria bacterium]|nr:sigma-70 family RNA polymerase sigma factor [Pseudomonadota bacterium]
MKIEYAYTEDSISQEKKRVLMDSTAFNSPAKRVEIKEMKRIVGLEKELWQAILDNSATVGFIIDLIQNLISSDQRYDETKEMQALFMKLARLAGRVRKSAGKQHLFKHGVVELTEKMCEIDIDRELVGAAGKEIIKRGTKHRVDGVTALSAHSKVVKEAICRVELAKHGVIQANQGLVNIVAQRYKQKGMPVADLRQEGNLGLIKAINRFDHRLGYQFSSYASWWIRSAISRALALKGTTIRIPEAARRTRVQVIRAAKAISSRTGRPPTDEELAIETGMDPLSLERTRKTSVSHICSLYQEVSDSNSLKYIDIIIDEAAGNPLEETIQRAQSNDIYNLIKLLTPIERCVIRQRFGLEGSEAMTLQEISEQFDLSRERIRQIQNKALAKLRDKIKLDAA